MTVTARLPLLVLVALAATGARAQFQPVVMRSATSRNAEIVTGRWSAGTAVGVDVMALNAAAAPGVGSWWARGDLLTPYAAEYTGPASVYSMATGWFDASSDGSQPDVLWGRHVSSPEVSVSWAATKAAAPDTFSDLTGNWVWGAGAVRLLPRAQPLPVLVSSPSSGSVLRSQVTAVDLADARSNPTVTPPFQPWSMVGAGGAHATSSDGDSFDRVIPLAVSPAARAAGVEDALIPLAKGFYLLWHGTTPVGGTLATSGIVAAEFGMAGTPGLTAEFLPPGAPTELDLLGAAAGDVDGDGVPDLVFSYGSEVFPDPGWLLWIRNTGSVVDMQAQRPWGDLRQAIPELAQIVDPGLLRPLDLGEGDPAFAVFDRGGGGVFVVRGNGLTGFDVDHLPVPAGATIRDLVAADVVGSPARDLVVIVDLPTIPVVRELWVYPDEDDLAPRLTWAPVPPTVTPMGIDLELSVDASDADSPPPTVTWLRTGFPAVEGGSTLAIDGATLCDPATPTDVTVRALDNLGVYVTIDASISVEERPSLGIAAVPGSGRIVVRPGGVTGWAEGQAWPRCGGSPTFEWGEVGLTGLTKSVSGAGSISRSDFAIPESSYPDLLDGEAALSLRAFDAGAGRDGTAQIRLEPDARELVAASLAFDRIVLAPGELAIARATIESRVGVPLPRVRIAFRLDGLAIAGTIEALGAAVSARPGPGEVVLDPLPAAGVPVELQLPVRSLGGAGAVGVEIFSEGSHRLSPESSPRAEGATPPGCSCGERGAGPFGLLFLAAIAARRRQPQPRRPGSGRGSARDGRGAQS